MADNTKICPVCGAETDQYSAFCGVCGAKISDPAPVESVAEEVAAAETSDSIYDNQDTAASNPYGDPQANPYEQQATAGYGDPQANPYGQQAAPGYGDPQANPYGQQANPYGQQTTPGYGDPQANAYGTPPPNAYDAYGQQVPPAYGGSGYPSAYGAEQKSKLTAGLLGIFLGGVGVHRFYLGYTGIGIAQIAVSVVTCGIGGVWGIIEGILILVGNIKVDAKGIPLKEN